MKPGTKISDLALGLVYLGVAALLVLVAVLVYNKAFVSSVDVKLSTGTLGNALQTGSDVKLNGVPVGEVSGIDSAPGGATLTLALKPATADELPPETTARLLPKTLFGERYVSLVTPLASTGGGLSAGDHIHQDRSDEAVELEELFDELLPLLQSIQPEKLAATLGELSTALRGQGEQIGDTLGDAGEYLTKLNPEVPQMAEDFAKLAEVTEVYSDAAPDLLEALDTMTTTSRTLVDQRSQLSQAYARVIGSADTTEGWVSRNQRTIIVLSRESRAALGAARPYANQFPCMFRAARDFIPEMDKVLGAGTAEPGVHVSLQITESRGKYVPGRDRPRFATGGKARCPYVTGRTGARPASAATTSSSAGADGGPQPGTPAGEEPPEQIQPPPSQLLRQQADGTDNLGDANSPAENRLIAEIEGSAQGVDPDDYPSWGSLLVGPTLRGAEVTVR
ncbi:MCE family protein [Aeromicrobium sp. CTD01-1L150]|uniref:MCE family protein n=1 Tax=Aeromicrobium sp. CTD01-1L150 TaxID=3341830 RepID=UPI0035C11342